MYPVSAGFLTKIKEPSRNIKAKVNINGVDFLENVIQNFTVEASMGSGKLPTIGGTVAVQLKLTLINDASLPSSLIGVPIIPSVAIEVTTGIYEWVDYGEFYAETGDVKKTDATITIDCFDIMPSLDNVKYGSQLTFPAPIADVISEIATMNSLTFETQTLPSITVDVSPTGTVRQALGQIACLISTNIIVNKSGKLEFRFTNTIAPATFSFDGNNYVDFKLLSGAKSKISQITIEMEDKSLLVTGDSTGLNIKFQNSLIRDQSILDTVFARVYPILFDSYKMKCQGFPHLNVGDIVQFTDVKAVVRNILIANVKLTYNGGLISDFGCEAIKEGTKDVTITGGSTVGMAMDNFSKTMEQAIINATNLLTGTSGGHVYLNRNENGQPFEILIMETPTLDDPDNLRIWKWSSAGLGYSSTGYLGTYDLAITSAGEIVADFITVGTLNADIIKAGILKSVNGNAQINMLTGEFQFGGAGMTYSNAGFTVDNGAISNESSDLILPTYKYVLSKVGTITNIVVTKSTDNTTFVTAILGTDYSINQSGAVYILENITAGNLYYKISYDYTTSLLQSLNSKADGTELVDMNNYMVFDQSTGLTLGDKDTTTKVNISDTGINFINNGQVVAYITGQKLNIYTAEIIDSLILGNFAFTPRTNGNLSFGKRV